MRTDELSSIHPDWENFALETFYEENLSPTRRNLDLPTLEPHLSVELLCSTERNTQEISQVGHCKGVWCEDDLDCALSLKATADHTSATTDSSSWKGEYPGVYCERDLLSTASRQGEAKEDCSDMDAAATWPGLHAGVYCEGDLERVIPPKKAEDISSLLRPQESVIPPNIEKGLGQRKDTADLKKLENFCTKTLNFSVYSGRLYLFWQKCWVAISSSECRVYLRRLFTEYNLDTTLITPDYDKIYNLLLCNPSIQRDQDFSPPPHCLNFADGTLDLCSMELRPHNPEDGFLHYINLNYHDVRDASYGHVFETFAQRNSEENSVFRTQILELVMLALLGYNFKHFYVLLGQSNTGKTEFSRFLVELVGRDNVAAISGIHDFANRFTISDIVGKLLCTCLDLPDSPLPSVAIGTVKQLVGDDPIKAEAKYKASYTAYKKPLLLLCGNHPIRLPNLSKEQALLNRMVVIPFGNPVDPAEQQQEMYKLLLNESAYIVSESIKAYRDLMERDFGVTVADIPAMYLPQDSRDSYQSVQAFVQRHLVLDVDGKEATSDIFYRYQHLAQRGEYVDLTFVDFSRCLSDVLKQFGKSVRPEKRIGPKDARGYDGIKLRPI